MPEDKTSADKMNAYKIYCELNQVIFKHFIEHQGDDVFKYSGFSRFDRTSLSSIAISAARAIMNDPRLNVVLKKG